MSPYNNQPDRKHLFLTGPKQIGKSTVLRKLLQDRDEKIGGFRTVRIPLEDGASIHMVAPSEREYTDELTQDTTYHYRKTNSRHQARRTHL